MAYFQNNSNCILLSILSVHPNNRDTFHEMDCIGQDLGNYEGLDGVRLAINGLIFSD